MGREIEIEPGDYPDPVIGYYCDPVDRVCVILKLMLAMQVGTFVMMTAFMTLYARP